MVGRAAARRGAERRGAGVAGAGAATKREETKCTGIYIEGTRDAERGQGRGARNSDSGCERAGYRSLCGVQNFLAMHREHGRTRERTAKEGKRESGAEKKRETEREREGKSERERERRTTESQERERERNVGWGCRERGWGGSEGGCRVPGREGAGERERGKAAGERRRRMKS